MPTKLPLHRSVIRIARGCISHSHTLLNFNKRKKEKISVSAAITYCLAFTFSPYEGIVGFNAYFHFISMEERTSSREKQPTPSPAKKDKLPQAKTAIPLCQLICVK